MQRESQPPRPNNKMVGYYTLRQFNLAAGVKTEFLKVDPKSVVVDVDVEVDEVFKQMLDEASLARASWRSPT